MQTNYSTLLNQIKALSSDDKYLVTSLANISSMIYQELDNLNWVGFYIVQDDNLHLGPFCGKPACTFIKNGRGVCGTALKTKTTQCVENVHEFAGHIACDSASNSEIVIPLFNGDDVIAVLDIDSVEFSRFKQVDKDGLENIAKYIETLFKEKTYGIC